MKRYTLSGAPRKLSLFACIAILGALMFTLVFKMPTSPASAPGKVGPGTPQLLGLRVVHVTDGDTLQLSNGERVRLIGIDTPELHENAKLYRDAERTGQDVATILRMGQKAYQFTRTLVEGKTIRLELDAQPRDKYGRLLAYVYLEDGTFVNAEIMKNGYAYPMTIPPNVRYAGEFREFFAGARRAGSGLWAEDHPKDRHATTR